MCNTVTIKKIKKQEAKNTDSKHTISDYFEYIADSPDEKALVEAAYHLNVKLIYSDDKIFRISIDDRVFVYEKLKVIEFDSIRKRMSVVVRDPVNRIYLICKGADSELINLISKGKTKEIYHDIDSFAIQGLRTLTIAYRCLTDEELDEYLRLNKLALEDFANKKQKVNFSISYLFPINSNLFASYRFFQLLISKARRILQIFRKQFNFNRRFRYRRVN